jgi:7-cyano-7-deazaguanine reductase
MFSKDMTPLDDAIKKGMFPDLETFPCPYETSSESSGIIRIVFPEFTCVCPRTGYPDFASIELYYLPDKLCMELKSWKLYLSSFRMIGTFHETVTAHLFDTIKNLLQPRWALMVGNFFPRGNVDTTIIFETETPRPRGADVLINNFNPIDEEIEKE